MVYITNLNIVLLLIYKVLKLKQRYIELQKSFTYLLIYKVSSNKDLSVIDCSHCATFYYVNHEVDISASFFYTFTFLYFKIYHIYR